MSARYAHTNLVVHDLQRMVDFYVAVFGCVPGVERVYETDAQSSQLEAGTGWSGLTMRGVHLALPGHGEDAPTLEVLEYRPHLPRLAAHTISPGFGHVAFEVDDLDEARRLVTGAGGKLVGTAVTVPYPTGGRLTWCYVRDPEGNLVELQRRV